MRQIPTIAAWPYDRPVLLGREIERARVCALLAAVHAGNGGALVVRGEPGVGKTALLADVAASVAGMAVVRARGVESEAELPHASLHELLRPLLARLDELPERQAAALRSAFGL